MNAINLKIDNKHFGTKQIFKDASISIEKGRLVAIIGRSGIGKTTLLNMIGLIDKTMMANMRLKIFVLLI